MIVHWQRDPRPQKIKTEPENRGAFYQHFGGGKLLKMSNHSEFTVVSTLKSVNLFVIVICHVQVTKCAGLKCNLSPAFGAKMMDIHGLFTRNSFYRTLMRLLCGTFKIRLLQYPTLRSFFLSRQTFIMARLVGTWLDQSIKTCSLQQTSSFPQSPPC